MLFVIIEINHFFMEIKSPAFLNNQYLPINYTCDGEGVNPPLEFLDVPKEAKSLALVISDPDAPGGTWYHWVMWNISPETKSIAENSIPAKAVVGQGSDGQNQYGPACPPFGIHHYIFTLYALGVNLDLEQQSTIKEFEIEAQSHILYKAELTGLYGKF